MKRSIFGKLLWVWAVMLLALTAPDGSALTPGTSWFPLQSSNEWVLATTQAVTRTIACAAVGPAEWQLTGLFDEPVFVRYSAGLDLNLQASPTGRGHWQTVFRFGRSDNLAWPFNLTGDHCGGSRASWTANDATIVTPAGTFTGCRHWQSTSATTQTNDCPASAAADVWFAPGVGPVALQSGDGQVFLLSSATVGTHIYPPPPTGMEASLTADQSSYTNISNHLVICPPCTTNVPPCEVPCRLAGGTNVTATFAFQVTNASSNPQTLTFLTGQRFDLQLIDTNGTVVVAWSDGKAFPQYATTVTFARVRPKTTASRLCWRIALATPYPDRTRRAPSSPIPVLRLEWRRPRRSRSSCCWCRWSTSDNLKVTSRCSLFAVLFPETAFQSNCCMDISGTKTRNTSCLKVLPDSERQGSVNVVYIPDRISHCPTVCEGTNHSAGQITRRRKADRLWAINPRKPSTNSRRRSRPKPTN